MTLPPNGSIEIQPVLNSRDLHQFIHFPVQIYRDDPHWVHPLIQEEKKRLIRKKNPFFEHGEAQYFLARNNGHIVGRISAHIDHLHNKTHNEKTGFFGFFESINDEAVSRAMFDQAAEWLCAKGMNNIRGPLSFSLGDEVGVLIDGFDHAPFIMMAHSPPYYRDLLEGWGMKKAKDLFCWKYSAERPIPEPAMQIAELARSYPGLKVREVDRKNIERDIRIIVDVFNSAWCNNWGFVPMTEKEIGKAVQDFKLILEPKHALIAEVNGTPAAISLALPNINEIIHDLGGRLFPFGIFKLLYRLKTKKIRWHRLIALGVKKEFRHETALKGVSVLLYTEMHRRGQELGILGGELSWTLENNEKINHGIEMMGGEHYKTYRIYEKSLEGTGYRKNK